MKRFVIALIIIVVCMSACSNENVSDVESDKIEYEDNQNVVIADEANEEIEYKVLDNEEYVLNIGGTSGYIAREYEAVDFGENYTVEREMGSNKYIVTVFNDNGVIFKNVFFGVAPVVKVVDNNLLEVFKMYGNENNYSVFVDVEKELVSNALNVRQPAFIINEKVLTIREIDGKNYVAFDSLFDVRASVDKYELKNAINSNYVANVIKNIGYVDNNTIEVTYLDVDYNVQSQEIKVVELKENEEKINDYNDEYVLYVNDMGYTANEYKLSDSGKNYTVEWEVDTDKYRVTVFNNSGVIFKDVFFGTSPSVEMINSNLLAILKGYGSGAYFSVFIDTEKELVSKALNVRQPVFVVNDKVLDVKYIDDKVYATFTSLFDNRVSVDKYELKNANGIYLALNDEDVSYFDNDTIVIKYLDVDSNLQSQKIKIVNLEEVSKEKNVYNNNNDKVNRFLQYLNDEIPMYTQDGSYMYFSERINDNEYSIVDYGYYYIFDIDGDGEDEFFYYYHPYADIIKYDHSSDSFVLWLETSFWSHPLATLQMYYDYHYDFGTHTAYEQYIFDEFSNLISTEYYSIGVVVDKEGNVKGNDYNINGKEVTEDEWNRDSIEFFEFKENAPNSLKYSDLLVY